MRVQVSCAQLFGNKWFIASYEYFDTSVDSIDVFFTQDSRVYPYIIINLSEFNMEMLEYSC